MKRLALFALLLVPTFLFAAAAVPDTDPLIALLELVQNLRVLSPLLIASAVLTILVNGVKKYVPDFKYYKILTVVGGIAYGMIQAISSGMSFGAAAVFVLISSGGAVLLYEIFKSPLNAAFQIPKAD